MGKPTGPLLLKLQSAVWVKQEGSTCAHKLAPRKGMWSRVAHYHLCTHDRRDGTYLTGPEDDPVLVLRPVIFVVFQLLPFDAHGHWPQLLIHAKVIGMLWREKGEKVLSRDSGTQVVALQLRAGQVAGSCATCGILLTRSHAWLQSYSMEK